MNIISPYKNVEQYTRIIIEPHQMNSDIRNHMKYNLKKKVEKKCNKNGYVDEIYKITSYSDGHMIPENLSGNAIYDVTYHCKLCIPIENSIIIGQVKVINQELIVAINGSIIIFMPRENIDPTYWINNIDNSIHKEKNIKLNIGDYV
jgi:DNA-directed RNA polymerase subunit E'/Rpb7